MNHSRHTKANVHGHWNDRHGLPKDVASPIRYANEIRENNSYMQQNQSRMK